MKIAFVWQGIDGRYGQWKDGLYAAMKIIEKSHTVTYHEPSDDIKDVDIILYWEAPVTACGKDRDNYERIRKNPIPKILLFAGGQVKYEWCKGFDLFLIESQLNEKEFDDIGLPWVKAFGVNTEIFKPKKQPKIFDGMHQGTCASWKRQSLFARALKDKGVICGRFQESDPIGFLTAREQGTLVLPELSHDAVSEMLNATHVMVNTSEYWGGGQRATLEAMACGIPVIAMNDSPKNMEYVLESGAGLIVAPSETPIREAIESIKGWTDVEKQRGIAYVRNKWTEQHYAENILKGINQVLNK